MFLQDNISIFPQKKIEMFSSDTLVNKKLTSTLISKAEKKEIDILLGGRRRMIILYYSSSSTVQQRRGRRRTKMIMNYY